MSAPEEDKPTQPVHGEELADNEADFEDDEMDIGEALTDEQLKALGIDMDKYNEPLRPEEMIDDNKSWITDQEGPDDMDSEAGGSVEEPIMGEPLPDNVSVQSFSDKIIRSYKEHTDAVLCVQVLNGAIFSGGMDDMLIKWNIDSDTSVKSHKFAETVSFLAKREESDLLAAGFLDDKIIVFKGSTFEQVCQITTEYEEIAVENLPDLLELEIP